LKFYKFYYDPSIRSFKGKKEMKTIDMWLSARFKEVYQEYLKNMENFGFHKATRLLFDLLGDFSRWWLRRSRERFQNPKNKKEFINAYLNFQDFLYDYLKMLAPLSPFVSEYIYQEIKDDLRTRYPIKESIHLEKLGEPLKLTLKEKILLEEMEKIRMIASEVHRLRKENNLKLRLPLKSLYLKTKYSPEVLEILKDEINVMEIIFGEPKEKEGFLYSQTPVEFWLDTKIDEKQKVIGIVKDFVRMIQDLRQDAGLMPKENVLLKFEAPKLLSEIINKNIKTIERLTKSKLVKNGKVVLAEKETDYENFGKVRIVIYKS
jgi:isoleucyl-tRNA synthetase